jgi:hypothetical protein
VLLLPFHLFDVGAPFHNKKEALNENLFVVGSLPSALTIHDLLLEQNPRLADLESEVAEGLNHRREGLLARSLATF